mmetsp:Transcript_31694/g.48531  ORF Transcript_31694/g.48531 Transcript_31694/m.48531 type:complete len:124 (-) Transcript_31694:532-903(-)
MLRRLFLSLTDQIDPAVEQNNMKTPLWREFGFQNENARTDFRAAGFFGLRQLVYFAENYNEDFHQIAQKCKGQTFFLALQAIEISHYLIRYFHLNETASKANKTKECSRLHFKNMLRASSKYH